MHQLLVTPLPQQSQKSLNEKVHPASGRLLVSQELVADLSAVLAAVAPRVAVAKALLSHCDYSPLCLLWTNPASLPHVNEPRHTMEPAALAREALAGVSLSGLSLWSCPLLSFPDLWINNWEMEMREAFLGCRNGYMLVCVWHWHPQGRVLRTYNKRVTGGRCSSIKNLFQSLVDVDK